jgi:O-antigen/teichoic acid export membrane protein
MLMHSISVKNRAFFSITFNIIRAALNFMTMLLIARWLMPDEFGNYMFIFMCFVGLLGVIDSGLSMAFFTFISKFKVQRCYFDIYALVLLVQILVVVSALMLMPNGFFSVLFDSISRINVMLGFLSTITTQFVWSGFVKLYEAQRKTIIIQMASACVSLVTLLCVIFLHFCRELDITFVFLLYTGVSAAAIFIVGKLTNVMQFYYSALQEESFYEGLKKFYLFSRPLFVYGIVGSLYLFTDSWMLQHFFGNSQQGYFQVGMRFSAITLFALRSVLNIYQKEMTVELNKPAQGNAENLFSQFSSVLLFTVALVCAVALPWSMTIIKIMLGAAYGGANLVFQLILVYTIFQGYCQLVGVMYYSAEETKMYSSIVIKLAIFQFFLSYFLVAPTSYVIPGLGMGAVGLCVKILLGGVLGSFFLAHYFMNKYKWNISFIKQFVPPLVVILSGFIEKKLWHLLFAFQRMDLWHKLGFICFCYIPTLVSILCFLLYRYPNLLGFSYEQSRFFFSVGLRKLKFRSV